MVVIKRYLNKHDAYIDQSFLKSHGIITHIHSDDLGSTTPHLSYLSNVLLLASETDKETACHLLQEVAQSSDQTSIEPNDDPPKPQLTLLKSQVNHCFNAAIISFFIPVVANLFSIYTCLEIKKNHTLLTKAQKKTYTYAILINLLVLMFYGVLFMN